MEHERLERLERPVALRDSGALRSLSPRVMIGLAVGVMALVLVMAMIFTREPKPMTAAQYKAASIEAHRTAIHDIVHGGFTESAIKESVGQLAATLDGMRPPASVNAANDDLVAAYRDHASDMARGGYTLKAVFEAFESPSVLSKGRAVLKVAQAGNGFASTWSDLSTAQKEFGAAGMDAPTLAHPIKVMHAER
jgi:hypothetical protein